MWTLPPDEWDVIHEIEAGPDRSAAIVAAAIVEAAISSAVSVRLKIDESDCAKKVRKEILGVNAPLGSVAAKTRLAYLLGMIGESVYLDVTCIGEIRNKFAHDSKISSFSDQTIIDKCKNLRLIDQPRRVVEAMGTVTDMNGNSQKFETAGTIEESTGRIFACISVIDCEKRKLQARGRFLLTARLITAAFNFYSTTSQFTHKPMIIGTII